MRRISIALIAAVAAMSFMGCQSGPKTYDISVELAPEVRQVGTTNVHLIGLSDPEKIAMEDDEPADYWDRSPEMRARSYPAVHAMRFDPDSAPEMTLKRSEPAWTAWKKKKATWIAVLTEGAGTSQMLEFIPLTEDWGERQLRVLVGPGDLTIRADTAAQ